MALNNIFRKLTYTALLLCAIIVTGCTISYKFTGASIDYTKVKTISLETFQNRAAYQWGPMATMFNEKLNDIFVQQTSFNRCHVEETCSLPVKLPHTTSSTSLFHPTAIHLWSS